MGNKILHINPDGLEIFLPLNPEISYLHAQIDNEENAWKRSNLR